MLFDFYSHIEKTIAQNFLHDKYVIVPTEDNALLHEIRRKIAHAAAAAIGYKALEESDLGNFLNTFHQHVSSAELNDVRLYIISEVNKDPWFRIAYYNIGKNSLALLVGNELAMQRRVNLSIQLPNDDSSLLPVHADVWSGDSPYEIVMWLPLVDCYDTKSMYFTNAEADENIQLHLREFKDKSSEDLYQAIEDNIEFLNVPFGSALFFSQNVMHGNRINRENETRWSMNCRFKSILTPYDGKKLGEFFEPITLRPITRIGLDYRLPEGLDE